MSKFVVRIRSESFLKVLGVAVTVVVWCFVGARTNGSNGDQLCLLKALGFSSTLFLGGFLILF